MPGADTRGYAAKRDHVKFFLSDVPIGSFGSQGQVRAATIALCLALARISTERSGDAPILLRDDERKLDLMKLNLFQVSNGRVVSP